MARHAEEASQGEGVACRLGDEGERGSAGLGRRTAAAAGTAAQFDAPPARRHDRPSPVHTGDSLGQAASRGTCSPPEYDSALGPRRPHSTATGKDRPVLVCPKRRRLRPRLISPKASSCRTCSHPRRARRPHWPQDQIQADRGAAPDGPAILGERLWQASRTGDRDRGGQGAANQTDLATTATCRSYHTVGRPAWLGMISPLTYARGTFS